MSESARPKKGLVDGTTKDEVAEAATSALQTKTQVVKFDDFQSSFFPVRPDVRRAKETPGQSDGSAR